MKVSDRQLPMSGRIDGWTDNFVSCRISKTLGWEFDKIHI